jgi:hypothetical protein
MLRREMALEHVHDLETVPMQVDRAAGVGDTRYFKDADKGFGWVTQTWQCPRCPARVIVREMMQEPSDDAGRELTAR